VADGGVGAADSIIQPMHQSPPGSNVMRLIALGQLAIVVVGTVILIRVWRHTHDAEIIALFACALVVAALTAYGLRVLDAERRAASDLERSIAEERQVKQTLEHAVQERTTELDDAQRVLQRMWWLGQQITLELDSQRVIDRFLEAVVDIAQADAGVVGLIQDDGRIRFVVGTGDATPLIGTTIPMAGSAMGRIIRSGIAWTVSDVRAHQDMFDPAIFERVKDTVSSLAIVPISRRGDRIGAVTVASRAPSEFTAADLERIEAMGDLVSVALENAELVETLRQAEWRFRTLFRAAPDAVLTVLQSGQIREANDAVGDITGVDPLDVVGRLVTDFVVDADRQRLRSALEATLAGAATRLEVAFEAESRGSAARRLVALAMTRLPEADPPSVLVVGRDITSDREMRLRLMESDRLAAVGELVAGVAHEVNNPLSSISAFAQLLLRDGGLTPTQRESVDVIRSETQRASQVVKDLLAFARRGDASQEPLDLNNLLSRTLRLRGYQLTSNKIELETDLASELPAVMGDARQLQQVFLNLITNAIQAMAPRGGGTLFVSTRDDQSRVILEMRDTGPGIPEPVRAHIFEPFFTTKGEGEGTGLGLSVSYGIVTAHGGTIEVANSSPAGTTFQMSLPAVAEQPADQPAAEPSTIPRRSLLAGLRVLFIDDEPTVRAGIRSFGQLRGFTVVTAENGLEGLKQLRSSGQVDAVVCDLRMPGMDGPAFYDHLRRDRPGLAARTVFITGDVVASGGRAPAHRQPVLSKPFTFEKLEETLVALLRGTPAAGSAAR
jgi:two-component system, NtrC family, sensor kinase